MTCGKKRLLFVKATKDYNEPVISHISSVCKLLDVEFIEYDFKTLSVFENDCKDLGKFDFVYIAAHGNHACFGENAPLNHTRWADFGVSLCTTEIMNSGSVLFLGCCNGGLKRVAMILFCNCPQITAVCGPKWKVTGHDVAVAIHCFLYNLLISGEEPIVVAERTSLAVGYSFPIYDRYELESEIAIMQWARGFQAVPDDYNTSEPAINANATE